ncbi:hypothetical protein IFR23_00385 [Sphingomonas sp. CFBP 13603]|nr:hypothetical protein [Sphingomonas sp. CFBP 13603]MBE2990469.1 hypothetical protein [Sphingomonas sp. CFBP 13603]
MRQRFGDLITVAILMVSGSISDAVRIFGLLRYRDLEFRELAVKASF